jgi:hypothetical protein
MTSHTPRIFFTPPCAFSDAKSETAKCAATGDRMTPSIFLPVRPTAEQKTNKPFLVFSKWALFGCLLASGSVRMLEVDFVDPAHFAFSYFASNAFIGINMCQVLPGYLHKLYIIVINFEVYSYLLKMKTSVSE